MAKHTLRITYDDATGAVACEHGCLVEIAGHTVRASDAVELSADSAAAPISAPYLRCAHRSTQAYASVTPRVTARLRDARPGRR